MLSLALLLAAAAAPAPAPAAPPAKAAPSAAGAVTTASGLGFETLEAGTGPRPGPNDAVLVMYQGRLTDGTVFDESREPVAFGVSELIPGFTEGLQLMNQGGIYRLRIPAAIGYGAAGSGRSIPPNADLEFTVLLLDIAKFEPPPAAPAVPSTK